MPVASKKPQSYAWIPVADAPGSLGPTLKPMMAGVESNFNAVQTTLRQIIAYLAELEAIIPPDWQARVYALEKGLEALEALALNAVYLTAETGGSTWNMADLDGYPNIRAVIIDPAGEANTLNLPTLGADDRAVFTIKCLGGGNVTLNAGAAKIVSNVGPGSATMAIPYAFVADGLTITTYSVTLVWTGSGWNIIDTAILTV